MAVPALIVWDWGWYCSVAADLCSGAFLLQILIYRTHDLGATVGRGLAPAVRTWSLFVRREQAPALHFVVRTQR